MITRHQRRFQTWGTYVHLETGARIDEAERIARSFLDDVDRACSRFRPDSDLSAANRSAGDWLRCSPLLAEATQAAIDAARVSDGAVDPLLGRTLIELGYDADHATLVPRPSPPATTTVRTAAWRELAVDPSGPAVRVPAGTALDLGATCKAWAADVLATTIAEDLETPTLVSLGGDLRVVAPPTAEIRWPVRITETPSARDDELPAEDILLAGGGLATSSTRVRRWRRDGVELHHLLDPRTGLPTTGPWRTVTATGPTCLAANVASTAAIVLGDRAIAWLERHAVDARLVARHGQVHRTGLWPGGMPREAS